MSKVKLLGWSIVGVVAAIAGIGFGVSSTMASPTITHNQLSSSDVSINEQFGLSFSPVSTTPAIDESKALAATDKLVSDFRATSRNIILVSASRHRGSDFVKVDPTIANGDPHITDKAGNFQDVPAYLVTLNGVSIPTQGGSDNGVFTSLNVLVDATNDNILMIYGYRKDQ